MRWIIICLLSVSAYAAKPLVTPSLAEGTGGWVAMGEGGAVRVSRDAGAAHAGLPSLAYDYTVANKFGVAILPVEPGAIANADQIHFWVKTEFPTALAVVLNEKEGGNYVAMVWSPGSDWQEVRVEPREFVLSDNRTDPVDPDGRLDLDQVQGIGITDLSQMFANIPQDGPMHMAVKRHPGAHTLLVSGFEVLTDAAMKRDSTNVDAADVPQISWMTPGGSIGMDRSGEHVPGKGLVLSYAGVDDELAFFSRSLPLGIAAGATHISFDIASRKPITLAFALQEKSQGKGEGPRYNTTVEVRGGGKADHRDLALDAFTLDENGPPDSKSGLDVSSAKSLSIADMSFLLGQPTGENTVWISNLRFVRKN